MADSKVAVVGALVANVGIAITIVDVGPPLSMYIGPDEILLTFDVQFAARTAAPEVAAAVRDVERRIRERFPKIRRIYIEAVNLGATERAAPRRERVR